MANYLYGIKSVKYGAVVATGSGFAMPASGDMSAWAYTVQGLSLIHISEPTRLLSISYAVFCLKKKNITIVILQHLKHIIPD